MDKSADGTQHIMIIALLNQKGGVGKTRGQLARELDADSIAAREIAALATEVLRMAR